MSLRRLSRAGFSLVEVLIGASILAVSLLGAFSAHLAADKLTRESDETERARAILESAMQRVLLEGATELASGATYASGDELAFEEQELLGGSTLVFTTPNHVAGDPTPAVLEVRLDLSWTTASGIARTVTLTSATR